MKTFQRRVFHLEPKNRQRLSKALEFEMDRFKDLLRTTPADGDQLLITRLRETISFCEDLIHQLQTPTEGHVEIHFLGSLEAKATARLRRGGP